MVLLPLFWIRTVPAICFSRTIRTIHTIFHFPDVLSLVFATCNYLLIQTRELAAKMAQEWRLSYATRRTGRENWTYDSLSNEVLVSKKKTVDFLMEKGVLKETQFCPVCSAKMNITKCSEEKAVEEVQFRCQKRHFESGGKNGGVLK